jgi:hypothetical protein
MVEFIDKISPVLSGLAGGFFVFFLISITRSKSRLEGDLKILEYGKGYKVISILFIPFTILLCYLASKAQEGKIIAYCLCTFFIVSSIWLIYEIFLVKISYDNNNVYYKSPLKGSIKANWKDFKETKFSKLLQADYLIFDGIKSKLWFSPMKNGYLEFITFLEHKINR